MAQVQIVAPREDMAGWTHITQSLCISRDALVLYGFTVEGVQALVPRLFTLHEGRNALMPIVEAVNLPRWTSWAQWYGRGIELDNGLFVDFTTNIVSATIFWRPRREREAG